MTCHQSGEAGHIQNKYHKDPRSFKDDTSPTVKVEDKQQPKYCVSGTIIGTWTSTVVRDSGCSSLIVSEDALPAVDTTNCRQVTVLDYLGQADKFPV